VEETPYLSTGVPGLDELVEHKYRPKDKITPHASDHEAGHLAPDDFHEEMDRALSTKSDPYDTPSPFSEQHKKMPLLPDGPDSFLKRDFKQQATERPQKKMSTTKSTFAMAKGAFVEGGKLAGAKKLNAAACRAFAAGLKKAGIPEEILTTDMAQKLFSLLAPTMIYMAATHFEERIPKPELVKAACEKALTVASMESIEDVVDPLLQAMMPAIMEMVAVMTETQAAESKGESSGVLGEQTGALHGGSPQGGDSGQRAGDGLDSFSLLLSPPGMVLEGFLLP
jgi:hypothetical protein